MSIGEKASPVFSDLDLVAIFSFSVDRFQSTSTVLFSRFTPFN